jgi:hypothetical protein
LSIEQKFVQVNSSIIWIILKILIILIANTNHIIKWSILKWSILKWSILKYIGAISNESGLVIYQEIPEFSRTMVY